MSLISAVPGLPLDRKSGASENRTHVFKYNGGLQKFKPDKTGIYIVACFGAPGGSGYAGVSGNGGLCVGSVYLTAGLTYYVAVGGRGGRVNIYDPGWPGGGTGGYQSVPSFAGGGGGGYSGFFVSQTLTQANAVIIAGGGGGGGGSYGYGGYGAGNTQTGGNGGRGPSVDTAGLGGSIATGGSAGQSNAAIPAGGGSALAGGGGGAIYGGGGGGGGYFGGGGGAGGGTFSSYYIQAGGGGGGSSYVVPAHGYQLYPTSPAMTINRTFLLRGQMFRDVGLASANADGLVLIFERPEIGFFS